MNIYQDCLDLIQTYIFGGVAFTPNTELVAIFLASSACIFLFSLPFLLVWKIIKMM